MKITSVKAHYLKDIPIEPPPFRSLPDRESIILTEVRTDDGVVGWGAGGYIHPVMVDYINKYLGPALVGRDPLLPEQLHQSYDHHNTLRFLGRAHVSAASMIDIALWDIKGKALGQPVHKLLGGANDKVAVYITHGAAYKNAPVYTVDELAKEARLLVEMGNVHIKNTVGRQAVPDPIDDYKRMCAIREAVGPDIRVAMDGNSRMSLDEAVRLCRMCEELDISFIEEPLHDNEPELLAHLRRQTTIPVAAAENHKVSARDLIARGAVDIIQPNVNNDGGYTAALKMVALAQVNNVAIGHGNGSGPHNVAFQCGAVKRGLVEYHFHKWMAYNAVFENVPQPENGWLQASQESGTGLTPKDGLIEQFSSTT